MEWCRDPTEYAFPTFVVFRNIHTPEGPVQKGRVVVDIRGLNKVTVPDVYPMPDQQEIIAMLAGRPFISVLDAVKAFHQFLVALQDRHKCTVVTHRGLETYLVAIMGYRGSPPYVQQISDEILRDLRSFMESLHR